MDKSTCWYLPGLKEDMESMKRSLPPLHESEHGKVLFQLIKLISNCTSSYLDLGCGLGTLSEYLDNYTGVDIKELVIHLIADEKRKGEYISLEIDEDTDLSFINGYDCVIANGFIDILENPLPVLANIFAWMPEYFILHRQEISKDKPTQVTKNHSYSGLTYHSIINENDFNNLLKIYGIDIIAKKSCGFNNWENGGTSFLFRK